MATTADLIAACQRAADYPGGAYGDVGQYDYALWAGGEAARGPAAAAKLLRTLRLPLTDRNVTREQLGDWADRFGRLRGAGLFADADRAEAEGLLRYAGELCLNRHPDKPWGTRPGDSDETIGHSLALKLLDKWLGTDFGSDPQMIALDAERARYAAILADGGEHCEGPYYNVGTLGLWVRNCRAHGWENHPALFAALPAALDNLRWMVLPDGTPVEYGDTQSPRAIELHSWTALLAELIQATGDPGGHGRSLWHHLTAGKDPWAYWTSIDRVLLAGFDPAAPPVPFAEPRGMHPSGVGLTVFRAPGEMVKALTQNELRVDHEERNFGDLDWWVNGEYVLEHPRGYMADDHVHNVPLYAALGSMTRRRRASAAATADGFESVGETWGTAAYDGFNDPPPDFLTTGRRTVRREPGRLVVSDSFAGRPPERLDRYNAMGYQWAARMAARKALWEQRFHCRGEPRRVDGGWEYTTAGGQVVRWTSDCARTYAEAVDFAALGGNYYPAEKAIGWWRFGFLTDDPAVTIRTTGELVGAGPSPPPPQPAPTWTERFRGDPRPITAGWREYTVYEQLQ